MKTVFESICEAREDTKVRNELREILQKKAGDQKASARMKEILPFTLAEILGKGQEGVCVKTADGKVLKVYYGEIPLCMSMLAAACAAGYNPETLPYVVKGDHWILRDLYKTKTPKCKIWIKGARGYMKEKRIVDKKFKDWCDKANYELSEIGAPPLYQADIKIDNFGEARDTSVRLIDF